MEKGSIFAPSKTAQRMLESFGNVHKKLLEKGQKKYFKFFFKKRCGIKKRVLYLHPLWQRRPDEKIKKVH